MAQSDESTEATGSEEDGTAPRPTRRRRRTKKATRRKRAPSRSAKAGAAPDETESRNSLAEDAGPGDPAEEEAGASAPAADRDPGTDRDPEASDAEDGEARPRRRARTRRRTRGKVRRRSSRRTATPHAGGEGDLEDEGDPDPRRPVDPDPDTDGEEVLVEAEPSEPAEKVLLVNAADRQEVRIVLLEDGTVEELYVEASEERLAAGSVYRGRVQNVEQGIGAAFVDLGQGMTGFLHVSDLVDRPPGATITDLLTAGDEVVVQVTRESVGRKGPALSARIALPGRYLVLLANTPRSGVSRRISGGRARDRIRKLLSRLEVPEGMGLIIRTAGEEASHVELEGDLRHLIAEWEGIQAAAAKSAPPGLLRPESDLAERSVRDIMPAGTARIVVDREDLADRIRSLLDAWYGAGTAAGDPPPAGVDAAPDPAADVDTPEALDEALDEDVDEDLEEAFEADLAEDHDAVDAAEDEEEPEDLEDPDRSGRGEKEGRRPRAGARPRASSGAGAQTVTRAGERTRPTPPEIVVHRDPMPLFHAYDVEGQLEEAYRRVLRLPSGGSIVIDPTEALVAVDVNSGRHTGETDPETTALQTNLEAAEAVARQLRLRDLGGQVVIDLIDLKDRAAGRSVQKALKKALARDRARIRVGRITPFGVVILSRQRIRKALSRVTHAPCDVCGGTGSRRLPAGLGLRVLREMQARAARARGRGGLEVRVPTLVHEWVRRHRRKALAALEKSCSGPVRLVADDRLPADGWAIKGLPPSAREKQAGSTAGEPSPRSPSTGRGGRRKARG